MSDHSRFQFASGHCVQKNHQLALAKNASSYASDVTGELNAPHLISCCSGLSEKANVLAFVKQSRFFAVHVLLIC